MPKTAGDSGCERGATPRPIAQRLTSEKSQARRGQERAPLKSALGASPGVRAAKSEPPSESPGQVGPGKLWQELTPGPAEAAACEKSPPKSRDQVSSWDVISERHFWGCWGFPASECRAPADLPSAGWCSELYFWGCGGLRAASKRAPANIPSPSWCGKPWRKLLRGCRGLSNSFLAIVGSSRYCVPAG